MDKDRKSARNVLFVNPSATPFMAEREEGGGNPSVRVYHINKKTFELVNYEQYFLNLTKANESKCTHTVKTCNSYTRQLGVFRCLVVQIPMDEMSKHNPNT